MCDLEKVVEILVHFAINVISHREIKIVLKRLEKVPQASSLSGFNGKSQAGMLVVLYLYIRRIHVEKYLEWLVESAMSGGIIQREFS